MRKLTLLVTLFVVAALAWGLYWFVGAMALERATTAWLDARRAEGWVAEAAIETRGFPNRFDTTFTGLQLADPDTRVGWSAPVFQMMALSYKPNHLIMIWPGAQRVSTPEQAITVDADRLRGSVIVDPESLTPLRSATVELAGARIASTEGWTAALAAGQVSMRAKPGATEPATYDVYIDLGELAPDAGFIARLSGKDRLPDTIASIRIGAVVTYDKPWDRTAIDDARPQPRKVLLEALAARWGDLDLSATGTLDIGPDGAPNGTLEVSVTNWRDMIEIARALGVLEKRQVGTVTSGMELYAALSGNFDRLDAPVSFRDGQTFIGPVPVGPSPIIHLP
jgi:hypothetical protein